MLPLFKVFTLGTCLFLMHRELNAQTCEGVVWSDEFDSNGAPNPDNWVYDLGGGGWGNGESQVYTSNANNVRIENGNLIVEAHKSGNDWTSARIKTQGKKNWLYGRIEFRAKLPTGSGTWPALWMLGESIESLGWPRCGEIDVMEHVGRDQNKIHGSLHTPSSNGATVNTGSKIVNTASTEFHTYSVDWDQNKIAFFIDGVGYYTYNPSVKNADTWPYYDKSDYSPSLDDKFFIIINIAMGGSFGGAINSNLTTAKMEVDYVRVYQPLDQIEIVGSSNISPGETSVKFRTNIIENATYSWTLPEGATIISGADTNEITVNWGANGGKVSVSAEADCGMFFTDIDVTTIQIPDGENFVLDEFQDNNFDRWDPAESPNSFTYTEENDELRIDYNVTDPTTLSFATFNFPGPTDMTSYSQLNIRMKTFNESGSVTVRADLFDTEGLSTTETPVFRISPLIDDGEYFTYSFDFNNNWGDSGNANDVNSEQIAGMLFYINYGPFALVDQDSIWLESVTISQPYSDPKIPLRPSHLSGIIKPSSIELTWQDNADNESNFALYRSTEPTAGYELIKGDIAANETSFSDTSISAGTTYYYKILATNSIGDSDFSNTAQPIEQVISALEDSHLTNNIRLFPNPTRTEVTIQLDDEVEKLLGGTVRLLNFMGQTISIAPITGSVLKLDLKEMESGIYFVKLVNENKFITKKVLKY